MTIVVCFLEIVWGIGNSVRRPLKMQLISRTMDIMFGDVGWVLKMCCFNYFIDNVLKRRSLQHYHNERHSEIPKTICLWNVVKFCLKNMSLTYVPGNIYSCCLTVAVFPGVRQKQIQQWRQPRARPGEKETLNIMLREQSQWTIRLKYQT